MAQSDDLMFMFGQIWYSARLESCCNVQLKLQISLSFMRLHLLWKLLNSANNFLFCTDNLMHINAKHSNEEK